MASATNSVVEDQYTYHWRLFPLSRMALEYAIKNQISYHLGGGVYTEISPGDFIIFHRGPLVPDRVRRANQEYDAEKRARGAIDTERSTGNTFISEVWATSTRGERLCTNLLHKPAFWTGRLGRKWSENHTQPASARVGQSQNLTQPALSQVGSGFNLLTQIQMIM